MPCGAALPSKQAPGLRGSLSIAYQPKAEGGGLEPQRLPADLFSRQAARPGTFTFQSRKMLPIGFEPMAAIFAESRSVR